MLWTVPVEALLEEVSDSEENKIQNNLNEIDRQTDGQTHRQMDGPDVLIKVPEEESDEVFMSIKTEQN